MDHLFTAAKTLAAIFVMSLIIPAMVWAGSGSLREAIKALRFWWYFMAALFLGVGALALVAVVMERIG